MNRFETPAANIQLRIDRLVLDGFNLGPRERDQLQFTIETELGRLLGEQGLHASLAGGVAIPSLTAAPIKIGNKLQSSASVEHMGQQIAHSVFGGIGHGPVKP